MNSFRERAIKAGVPVSADAAATIETVATAVKAIGDGFAAPVSRGAAAALGNVDAPTGAEDKREVPEELKNWKNPALYGAK